MSKRPTIEQCQAEVNRLIAAGWRKEDFAAALKSLFAEPPQFGWVEVTSDEWAEHCASFSRAYGTEGNSIAGDAQRPLVHKAVMTDTTGHPVTVTIGMVRYHDNIHKTYYIQHHNA
jgi:hypothetical protein